MLKKIILLSCFMFLLGYVKAFDVPAYEGAMTDKADLVTDEQDQFFENYLSKFEDETTVEVVVLTVNNLSGETPFDVVTQVWDSWKGIGQDSLDNGVLFLISKEDRKRFIGVGDGIAGILPDVVVNRIGEYNIPEYFKVGQYFSGIFVVVKELQKYILKDTGALQRYQENYLYSNEDFDVVDDGLVTFPQLILIYIGMSVVFVTLILNKKTKTEKK